MRSQHSEFPKLQGRLRVAICRQFEHHRHASGPTDLVVFLLVHCVGEGSPGLSNPFPEPSTKP